MNNRLAIVKENPSMPWPKISEKVTLSAWIAITVVVSVVAYILGRVFGS